MISKQGKGEDPAIPSHEGVLNNWYEVNLVTPPLYARLALGDIYLQLTQGRMQMNYRKEVDMQKGKIIFVGNFWEYFGLSIVLLLLTIVTFGIALPYWVYWSFKYFFSKMEIEIYAAPASTVAVVPGRQD